MKEKLLKLNKPLIFFDLESTGTDTRKDRIVELSTIKITSDGSQETITQRFNPGIPIPAEATAVHGIKDEDVISEPCFAEKAKEIYNYLLGSDLAGYNIITFDIRMLTIEFLRAGLELPFDENTQIIDAMRIFHRMEPRDLAAAYKFYCNKELTNAHQAEADTIAAIEVLQAQINKYGFEPQIDLLAQLSKYDKEQTHLDHSRKFIRNEAGDIVFNFGKHKGIKASEQLDYIDWMISKGDFDLHTQYIARQILEGKLK